MPTPRLTRVLFVCSGNICRSPTAAAVLADLAQADGWGDRLEVDSAGIHEDTAGWPTDERTVAAARARGWSIAPRPARPITAEDFSRFDLIAAMTRAHERFLLEASPTAAARDKVRLFLSFAPELGVADVPDPYHGGRDGFDHVLDLIEAGARGLLVHLRRERG